MVREYRVTTQNLPDYGEEDCRLDPNDPIHELRQSQVMGGLGARDRLVEIRDKQSTPEETWEQKYAREHGIRPGSVAWNTLMGSKKS